MFRVDKLNYYDKFSCSMGDCPENCCQMDWNILLDKAAYEKYQNCEDKRVSSFISVESPHLIMKKDGKCPFFQEDGLCFLHREYGAEFQCETCRNYPRFTSVYEDLYVVTLAPSCPAVLDILWEEEKTEIQTQMYYESQEELKEKEFHVSEEMAGKLAFRTQILKLAQNREFSLGNRVRMIMDSLGVPEVQADSFENAAWMLEFVQRKCLVNDKIKAQATMIKEKKTVLCLETIKNAAETYQEFTKFFGHLLVYSIFEQVLHLKDNSEKTKQEWFEKICLRLATIQYWIVALYLAKGVVTREDCNTAVYSIMRVIDHFEGMWEDYYREWKRTGKKIPEVLW